MRGVSRKETSKNAVRWELQNRENQVEDQYDDECWRLGGVLILALPNEGVGMLA